MIFSTVLATDWFEVSHFSIPRLSIAGTRARRDSLRWWRRRRRPTDRSTFPLSPPPTRPSAPRTITSLLLLLILLLLHAKFTFISLLSRLDGEICSPPNPPVTTRHCRWANSTRLLSHSCLVFSRSFGLGAH